MKDPRDDLNWNYIIDLKKLRKFLIDGDLKNKKIKEFFGSRGKYIFAQTFDLVARHASKFILNKSELDCLMSLLDKKAHPSLSGFLLEKVSKKTFLNILNENTSQYLNGILLKDYEVSKNLKSFKGTLTYEYCSPGTTLFPVIHIPINFESEERNLNLHDVRLNIFRGKDYRKSLDFFQDPNIGINFKLKSFNFDLLNNNAQRNKIISEIVSKLKNIDLEINSKNCSFKLLGCLGYYSVRDPQLKLEHPKIDEKEREKIIKTDLIESVDDIITEINSKNHAVKKLNLIFEGKDLLIYLQFIFSNRYELMFKSLKYLPKKRKEKDIEKEYFQLKSDKQLSNLVSYPVVENDINLFLTCFWEKSLPTLIKYWGPNIKDI